MHMDNRRTEIVELAGQIVNGILSADGSALSKLVDRALNRKLANSAVDMAVKMVERIDKRLNEQEQQHYITTDSKS